MAIDYQKMAQTIRDVRARRSARAESENGAMVAEGGTPLTQLLTTLDAAVGDNTKLDATLRNLADQTRANIAHARSEARNHPELYSVGVADNFLPEDPLLRKLAKFYSSQFLEDVPVELMPQAITEALSQSTDVGGIVVEEEAKKRLGGTALDLLCQVKAAHAKTQPQPTDRPRQVREYLSPTTLERLGRSEPRRTYVERMPVLASLNKAFGGPESLAGFRLTSVQHLFPSTMGLFDALDGNGLHRSEIGVGGKEYSSNPATVTRMQSDGFDVHWRAVPQAYAASTNAEESIFEMAKDQLARLFRDVTPEELDQSDPKRRFILLDDGGKLIRALHEFFPAYAKLCVAIEQTDRGIQVLEDMEARGVSIDVPVVNMARSVAKKESEGPMIGESVAFHTDIELARVDPTFEVTPKVATVIGYGAVGQATAAALKRRGYHVVVHDESEDAMRQAAADGYEPLPRNEALAKAHMLVGATGRGVLTPDEFDLLPDHAVLVNAASGNHEFGLDALDERALAAADPLAKVDQGRMLSTFKGNAITVGDPAEGPSNLNRVIRTAKGKEILALRSGSVVNMTLGLPPEYAQVTLGLLLAGTLTAATATKPGLIEIPDEMQRHIVDGTSEDLRRLGLDLDTPDFRPLEPWPG